MFEEIVTEDGVKFNNLEKKIYKFVCMLGCMIIKYILESRDKKLMKTRDKKKFRHKGYKQNCIKTIMGEIEYQRAVYVVKEDGETKYVYLLDEDMKIETIGKVSINLAEKALSIAVNTPSYRKGEEEIRNTTNETLSHEGLRKLVVTTGEKIELRVMNGDGARWIKNITARGAISQKDNFHIQQEIVRDIAEKEYRKELTKMIEEKRYNEVQGYIENLKYELGGEEKAVKKLNKLQSYLKEGLPRYQDILKEQGKEIPKEPEGIEYRNPGIMESQIFTVLKVRLASGRKSFGKRGVSSLAKVCAMKVEHKGNIEIEKIESPIEIDNSVEEWIKEIEENVRKNKKIHRANRKEIEENNATKNIIINSKFMKDIMRMREFSEMRCSF